jgi:hypothetical protein
MASLYDQVLIAFFGDLPRMQRSLAILCENNQKEATHDVVTHIVLMLLSHPVHIQMTAVGWQPLKGKELTFPFSQMDLQQRQTLKAMIDEGGEHWLTYEHAITYRQKSALKILKPLDVLQALCDSILTSKTYSDKRLRVAVCNIILQRVQSSITIERGVQTQLNARLFPPATQPASPIQPPQPPSLCETEPERT